MPPTWAPAPPPMGQTPMHANPDTKADVDSIILDYQICLAIHKVILAIETLVKNGGSLQDGDEVSWQVDTVKSLYSVLSLPEPEPPLAPDLGIKFKILRVAEQLLHVSTPQTEPSSKERAPLSQTGVMFVELCTEASERISISRFYDAVARFIVQAIIEDQREGRQPSKDLTELCSWTPGDPTQDSKWRGIRQRYVEELDLGSSHAIHKAAQQYPLLGFVTVIATFLRDLMATLEPPVLIQLERGKLGDLSREDTQDLKNLVGLR